MEEISLKQKKKPLKSIQLLITVTLKNGENPNSGN